MIRFVGHEQIRNLKQTGVDHLHGVAHARHNNHNAAINMVANGHIILPRTNGFNNHVVVTSRAQQSKNVVQRDVVLAHNGKRAVENSLVHRVKVNAQAVAKQRAAGDGTHWIKGDHRQLAAAQNTFARHGCNQRAFAGAWSASDTNDALWFFPRRGRVKTLGVRKRNHATKLRGWMGRWG